MGDSTALFNLGATFITSAVVILIIMGWGAYQTYFNKKNKGKEFGLIVTEHLTNYKMSIFYMLIIGFNVSEGIWAASIPVEGDAMSPLARLLGHLMTMALCTVGGIGFITTFSLWVETFSLFGKSSNNWVVFRLLLVRTVLLATLFFLGFFGPLFAAGLIAKGLNQTQEVYLFLIDWSPFHSDTDYLRALIKAGLPSTYNSLSPITYPMASSIVITFFHIIVIWYEAFVYLDVNLTKKAKASPSSGGNSGGNSGGSNSGGSNRAGGAGNNRSGGANQNSNTAGFDASVKLLLETYGIQANAVQPMVDRIRTAMEGVSSEPKRAGIIHNIVSLNDEAKALKEELANGNIAQAEYDTQFSALRTKIRAELAKSPSDKGVGITLPAPGN